MTEIIQNKDLTAGKIDTGVFVDRTNATALEVELAIKENGGAIPFSGFMNSCLYGENGFYSAGKARIEFGKDFVTTTEETAVVGATIGKAIEHVWEEMGKPESFDIVEMGAGRGGLAIAILEWSRELNPSFYKAIRYRILEYGALATQQKARLEEHEGKVEWVQGSAYSLPFSNVEGVFLSNELIDAFPFERVIRIDGQLKQKFIRIENDKWVETWEEPTAEVLEYIKRDNLAVGEEKEEPVCLHAERFQESVMEALKQGAIITIDYGQEGEVAYKNLAAVRYYGVPNNKGRLEDVASAYKRLGEIDMTANVNFRPLKKMAVNASMFECFSGDMQSFFVQLGANGVAKEFEDFMQRTDSWKKLVASSIQLEKYGNLLKHDKLRFFFVQMTSKGVKISFDSGDTELSMPGIPTIMIPVGEAKVDVVVSDKRSSERLNKPITDITSDDNGYIHVAPDCLDGLVISLKEVGVEQVIHDFTVEDNVKKAVEEMGCNYDI